MAVENASPFTLNSVLYYTTCMHVTHVHTRLTCNCQVWKHWSLLLWLFTWKLSLRRLFVLHAMIITPCLEVPTTAMIIRLSFSNLIPLFSFSYKVCFSLTIKKVDIYSWSSFLFWCSFVANSGKDISKYDALYHCIHP